MKIVKRCLLIYLTTFLTLFVSYLLWNNPAKEYLTDWLFYVLPLFVLAAGLTLGWFGFMIIQHLRWVKSFYLLGLNLCGIAVPGNQLPGYDSSYRRLVEEYNKDRKYKIAMLIETMKSVRHDPRMDSDSADLAPPSPTQCIYLHPGHFTFYSKV